jgi:ComF family protein
MALGTLLDEFAEAVLPQRCVACGRFGAAFHDSCIATMALADGSRCSRCWAPADADTCPRCTVSPPSFDALRARFRFEGDVRRALLEAKFRGTTSLLRPLAAAAIEAIPPNWQFEAVVPVPLHRSRERERGYNQATLVAKAIASRLGVPARADVLRRVRATPPQAGLNAEQRRRNLLGAFEARTPAPAAVLLVDDVTTTGATLEVTAAALRQAGARSVFALAIARED